MNTTKTMRNDHLDQLTAHYNANGWQHCDPGTKAVLRAFIIASDYGMNRLMAREMPAAGDMPLFAECLAEAGITEFMLCDRSSGLMETLHFLLADGWEICGTYEKQDRLASVRGLHMRKVVVA